MDKAGMCRSNLRSPRVTRRSFLGGSLLGALGGSFFSRRAAAAGPPLSQKPTNCLFIVLDAAHAAHTSMHGYHRDTTPTLNELSKSGFVFHSAFSQASATPASVRSYFTGRYPPDARKSVASDEFTVAQAFHANGFATALFTENPFVTQHFNYHKGVDSYHVFYPYEERVRDKETGVSVRLRSVTMYDELRAWLASVHGSPWFCYIHNLRPHGPYSCPEPFRGRFASSPHQGGIDGSSGTLRRLRRTATAEQAAILAALYDENLAYCDFLIGELIGWMRENGLLDTTLLVITSDHGEAFMQHGVLLHGSNVYDEMIHVPLVLRFPASSGMRHGVSNSLVELVDLFPTFLDLFGLDAEGGLHGESLLPFLLGERSRRKDFVFSAALRDGHSHFCVRTADRKHIVRLDSSGKRIGKRESYDLVADPGEKKDQFSHEGRDDAWETILRDRFPYFLKPETKPPDGQCLEEEEETVPDKETFEALRALGYVR